MNKVLLYRFLRVTLGPLFKIIFRPTYIGLENLPKNKGAVLAGNHTNNLDCILFLASNKRTIHFLAKKELVDGKLGFIFKRLGIIPVDRKNKKIMQMFLMQQVDIYFIMN